MTDVPQVKAAAIVLAGGDSTRMGSTKALLDWRGQTMIDHVLETARAGGCVTSFAVVGRDADAIQASAKLQGATVLVNENPDAGQISSIKLAMRNLDFSTDCALIWPVDCPLVKPADVRALIETYAGWRASLMRMFIPTHEGSRGHPMLVDIGFRQPFMELKKNETARTVIEANPTQVKEIPTSNPGVLTDIDTPEDYQQALKQG